VRRWQCGQPRARGVRQNAGARWRERRRLVARDGQEGSRISRISVVARSFLVAAEAERCVATAQAEVRVSTAPLDSAAIVARVLYVYSTCTMSPA